MKETAGDGPYEEQSSLVQAVVRDSGPIDLLYQFEQDRLRRAVSQFLGGAPVGERAALYKKASPMHQVGPKAAPILLIDGGAVDQVPVEAADRFVIVLDRAGLEDLSYHLLAYVDHCPRSLVRVPGLQAVVNEFFLRTLMHPKTAREVKRASR